MGQGQLEAYVGLCRFEKFQDDQGTNIRVEPGQTLPTFEAPVVVRAGSVLEYDQIATQLLPDFGYRLLRTENVMPINTWFETHGFNEALGELAKKVLKGPRLEIGTIRSVGFEQTHGINGSDKVDESSPLVITHHAFTPLADQTSIWPSDKRQWIDDDLKQLLFAQDLPTEQQYILGEVDPENPPLIRTYCIVDAVLRRKINLFFDFDQAWRKYVPGTQDIFGPNGNQDDIDIRCLFKGDTEEELKEVAPYLVEVTLPDRAFEDDRYVPDFHRNFFDSLWNPINLERAEGKTHLDTGIFIRTTADFKTVWQHFRKFPRLQDDKGKWFFWRFWDPITLRTMIAEFDEAQFEKLAGRTYLLMGKGLGNQMISLHYQEDIAARPTPTSTTIGQVRLNDFVTTKTLAASVEERIRRYEEKAMAFLRADESDRVGHLTDAELILVIQDSYTRAKQRNFSSHRDHLLYLLISIHLGNGFESDAQYLSLLERIGWTLSDGKKEANLPIAPFMNEVRKIGMLYDRDLTQPKRIILGFERIYSKPSPQVTYDTVAQRLHSVWPSRCANLTTDRLRIFIGGAGEIAQKELSLAGPDIETYVTLALYFGQKFAFDPLHPWAMTALKLDDPNERRHALGDGVAMHFRSRGYIKKEQT